MTLFLEHSHLLKLLASVLVSIRIRLFNLSSENRLTQLASAVDRTEIREYRGDAYQILKLATGGSQHIPLSLLIHELVFLQPTIYIQSLQIL